MDDRLYKVCNMLMEEVASVADKKDLTASCVENIKNCGECFEYVQNMMHADMNNGYPEGMRRPSYNGRYYYGMEHENDHSDMIRNLESIMNNTRNDNDRRVIIEVIEKLRKM